MVSERQLELVRMQPTEVFRTLLAVGEPRFGRCGLLVSARGVPIEGEWA
jgi:hypothetical protein